MEGKWKSTMNDLEDEFMGKNTNGVALGRGMQVRNEDLCCVQRVQKASELAKGNLLCLPLYMILVRKYLGHEAYLEDHLVGHSSSGTSDSNRILPGTH